MSDDMHSPNRALENLLDSSDPSTLEEIISSSENLLSQSQNDNSQLISVNIRLQHFNLLRVIGEGAFGKGCC